MGQQNVTEQTVIDIHRNLPVLNIYEQVLLQPVRKD
jgi:hypothetical protein